MKIIKFEKDRSQFMSVLRKNVNDYFKEKGLSTKGNWRSALKSVIMLSIYLAPFVLMLTVSMSGWMIFPLAVIMGIGMAGTGMSVMHDGLHGSSSKQNWLNDLLGSTIYMLGSTSINWKVQHNMLHHTFTNIEGMDEDIESKSALRLSLHAPLKKIHRYQYIYAFFLYSLMMLRKFVNDFAQFARYNKKGFIRQMNAKPSWEWVKLIGSKLGFFFTALGLPLLFSGFAWWLVILGFITMLCVGGFIMAIVFQMAHVVEETEQPLPTSEGNIENEWAIHQLQTTANFSKTAREYGLPYHLKPSFVGAIASHTRMLKTLGRKAA